MHKDQLSKTMSEAVMSPEFIYNMFSSVLTSLKFLYYAFILLEIHRYMLSFE
jgi:hypothetical protein